MKATTLGLAVCFLAVARSSSAQILLPGTTPVRLVNGATASPTISFTEGPLYDHNGGVYFTDIFSNPRRIYRYNIATGQAVVVDPVAGGTAGGSGGANGMYYNAGGQIVTADRDRRQLSLRSAANIAVVESVLVNQYNGGQFNGPNDLVIDSTGGIYFTDPDYENRQSQPDGFYYLSAQGVLTRLSATLHKPNGVILSPDGNTLYLAVETDKKILAYDVQSPGVLINERLFAMTNVDANGNPLPGITNGPDGLTIDKQGNVWAAVQRAVLAWNPAGQRLYSVNFPNVPTTPEDPTNLEFGKADGTTLYVTAGRSLYSLAMTGIDGDLNDDGAVDDHDIDILWQVVRGNAANDPDNNDVEDFDASGFVNEDDVDYMLANLLDAGTGRQYGDADLDGGVGGLDYTAWRQRAGTGWANGDFDGDGGVGGLDYTLWRTRPTQYPGTAGPHSGAVSAVPEPATIVLALISLGALTLLRLRALPGAPRR